PAAGLLFQRDLILVAAAANVPGGQAANDTRVVTAVNQAVGVLAGLAFAIGPWENHAITRTLRRRRGHSFKFLYHRPNLMSPWCFGDISYCTSGTIAVAMSVGRTGILAGPGTGRKLVVRPYKDVESH